MWARRWIRTLALCLAALMLPLGMGIAEGADTAMQDEHFVPENPDMTNGDVRRMELDLMLRKPVPGAPEGEYSQDGLLLAGGTINRVALPMSLRLLQGQRIRVVVTGRFESPVDRGLRIYLTDSAMDNCSNGTVAEVANDGNGDFILSAELIATKPADGVMLGATGFTGRLDRVVITSVALEADAETLAAVDPSVPYVRAVEEPWYQDMLAAACTNVGNNRRLTRVMERARAGEHITVATIGGSITEGAGATRYQNCYASRIWDGIRQRAGEGAQVDFVNAGVGGTPSTFGWMRFQRDITDRVKDDDGLADIVVIEYSVNDGGEPTNHGCVESMVRQVLAQPNEPAVILLFAVFDSGYNLQKEFRPIGDKYDLMMVSIKDGPFARVGSKWTPAAFFFDQYHPTDLGHAVMADCVLYAVDQVLAAPAAEQDIDLTVKPAYSNAYEGIRTVYADGDNAAIALERGGFSMDDSTSYTNLPVGRVCGKNFHHIGSAGNAPMTFTATFRNLLISYRDTNNVQFGKADVYVDGVKLRTLKGWRTGGWGQSVTDLIFSESEAREHTVTICMAEGDEDKKFTITCIGYTP